jgi:hypothetical protein
MLSAATTSAPLSCSDKYEDHKWTTLGSSFGAMQEVTLADHADHPVILVDDRNGADPALGQQFRDRRHGYVFFDCNHLARHHLHSAHRNASWLVPSALRGIFPRLALSQINRRRRSDSLRHRSVGPRPVRYGSRISVVSMTKGCARI